MTAQRTGAGTSASFAGDEARCPATTRGLSQPSENIILLMREDLHTKSGPGREEHLTRVDPLPDDEWSDETRAALAMLLPRRRRNAGGAGNALSTLVRHPELTKAYVTFSTHLMFTSTLPARLRELAILRIARRRNCEYEWVHHAHAADELGLSEAEIEAAGRGVATGPLEIAVLNAVDELDEDSTVSDRTWATLSEHLDERQRMDLVFTIGGYALLAMALNTFGTQLEHHLEREVMNPR